MTQVNQIDVATTNGCPEVTPAELLEEKATPDDLRILERAMGRFNSTTGFLSALKQVLTDLEGLPEVEALDQFIPIMAQVEAAAMNDHPSTVRIESTVSETERVLRVLHS